MALKMKLKSLREIFKGLTLKPGESPGSVADKMYEAIDPEDYGHYLQEALRTLAITYTADARRQSFKRVTETSRGGGAPSRVKMPDKRVQTMVDPVTGAETQAENPEFKRAKSFKAQLIKDEWEEFLDQNLPTESGGYIPIAQATSKDLYTAAKLRRDQAAANTAQADRYERLADVMVQHGASTLDQLTAEDVRGKL